MQSDEDLDWLEREYGDMIPIVTEPIRPTTRHMRGNVLVLLSAVLNYCVICLSFAMFTGGVFFGELDSVVAGVLLAVVMGVVVRVQR